MSDTPTIDRVLVTGATGFVGRNIVRRLLAKGITPVCLVRSAERLRGQHRDVSPDRLVSVVGSLSDRDALRSAMDCGLEVPPEVIMLAIQSVREHYQPNGVARDAPEADQRQAAGQFTYRKGDVNHLPRCVYHTVDSVLPGTVTRMETGPLVKGGDWGYLIDGEHVKAENDPAFFAKLCELNPHKRPAL